MSRCVLAHTKACDLGVLGRLHDHHVLPRQRIKLNWKRCAPDGADLDAALGDRRNLVRICDRHHGRITHGFDRPLLAEHLRGRLDDLLAFAAEIGMGAGLERELRLYGLAPSLFAEDVQ